MSESQSQIQQGDPAPGSAELYNGPTYRVEQQHPTRPEVSRFYTDSTDVAIEYEHNGWTVTRLVAASPSPVRQGDGWMPIETAPKDKDGPNIMLSNGVAVAQGWWCDEPGYIREKRDLDGNYIDQDESDGYTGWLDCDGGMLPEPTHWMPLPPAPADSAATGRQGDEAVSPVDVKEKP